MQAQVQGLRVALLQGPEPVRQAAALPVRVPVQLVAIWQQAQQPERQAAAHRVRVTVPLAAPILPERAPVQPVPALQVQAQVQPEPAPQVLEQVQQAAARAAQGQVLRVEPTPQVLRRVAALAPALPVRALAHRLPLRVVRATAQPGPALRVMAPVQQEPLLPGQRLEPMVAPARAARPQVARVAQVQQVRPARVEPQPAVRVEQGQRVLWRPITAVLAGQVQRAPAALAGQVLPGQRRPTPVAQAQLAQREAARAEPEQAVVQPRAAQVARLRPAPLPTPARAAAVAQHQLALLLRLEPEAPAVMPAAHQLPMQRAVPAAARRMAVRPTAALPHRPAMAARQPVTVQSVPAAGQGVLAGRALAAVAAPVMAAWAEMQRAARCLQP